ncbi:carboxyl transferase domain-containing protein [uncultured Sulfitobacter sp.]|uniref:acyl-CoA carboxylase subunit beta n=1 Tax=uncultured Sulfitobacter sp. TaxID=191468 RepID=UPI002637762C|nr:carboxyl transferase domain-containing protein [uncultured Sulfitobacter sp.]
MTDAWEDRLEEIQKRKAWSEDLGGEKAVQRQHDEGRLTIRERIDLLVDEGSFKEVGQLTGKGSYQDGEVQSVTPAPYVGGLAEIDGRPVVVGGEDFTVRGGSSSGLARRKGGQGGFIEDLAHEYDIPLINLSHGAGGSVNSLLRSGYAPLPGKDGLERSISLLGRVPVVGAVLGASAGGPAARAILTHWSVMTEETSSIMIAGPKVVERALGEKVDRSAFGTARMAVDKAGTIFDRVPDEKAAFDAIRRFLSYMPQNVWELPPAGARDETDDHLRPALRGIVPENRTKPYAMKKIVAALMDEGSVFEFRATYGKSVQCYLARLDGVPVGVVANNPMINGGALDGPAAMKYTNFIDLCDTFHLPIVFLVDSPGFMVGSRAEQSGALRLGVQCMMAVTQLRVPTISVIVRKCYGLGGGMSLTKNGLDFKIAWPSAEWGSLPREGGVKVAFRSEIENADDPKAREKEIEDELLALSSPLRTAEAFGIEDVIDPAETRGYLARYLHLARDATGRRLGKARRKGVRP